MARVEERPKEETGERNWLDLYNLEAYVFSTVRDRFRDQGELDPFDFFCIIAWKANRARSKVAAQLTRRSTSLQSAVREITAGLHGASSRKERFRLLIDDWGLRLPMASAVLTVFYPDEFTVYDVRACEQLGEFKNLADRRDLDRLWVGYLEYIERVHAIAPSHLSLRDKDRWLWARSFGMGLRRAVESGFEAQGE